MSPHNRYADAYLVAQAVNGTGQTIKIVGFLAAALITLGGLVVASQMGIAMGLAGLCFGILFALPFYALGVLVSAQGQILKATLDVAVNTSSIPSPEEIRHILGGTPPVVTARDEPLASQAPPRQIDTSNIASPSSSLAPQSADKRSCPYCGGALEPGVSRCRWCMKKI